MKAGRDVLAYTAGQALVFGAASALALLHALDDAFFTRMRRGVVALIISQYGKPGADGDWDMRPQQVESYLQASTIDLGLNGYDECYGNGRVDALRAVTHDTSPVYQPVTCEYYAVQPSG